MRLTLYDIHFIYMISCFSNRKSILILSFKSLHVPPKLDIISIAIFLLANSTCFFFLLRDINTCFDSLVYKFAHDSMKINGGERRV